MKRSGAPSRLGVGLGAVRLPSSTSAGFLTPSLASAPKSAAPPSQSCNTGPSSSVVDYFRVVWCKSSTRKHKKWEDDAVLIVRPRERIAVLKSMDGKEVGVYNVYIAL